MSPPLPSERRLLFLMNEALFFTTHRLPVALAAQQAGYEVHVAANVCLLVPSGAAGIAAIFGLEP